MSAENEAATLAFLYALRNRGSAYGIDRMRRFIRILGHPHQAYPVIHVAGSNGKGSVCAMLERIYRAAGYRTGLFTSPHLLHPGERIQVNRVALTTAEIVAQTNELRTAARALGEPGDPDYPSFFEFMTAMAFRHFAASGVEVALIETGLGGRLDATNVVMPEIAVITSIALDHTEILGNTLAAIAAEKAGIIKRGCPVVAGWLPAEALAVVHSRALELECPWVSAAGEFGAPPLMPFPATNLEGDFQRRNAAVALRVTRVLAQRLPVAEDIARQALLDVDWAGRWQRIKLGDGRSLILDASHNEEGARMLDGSLQRLRNSTGRKPVVCVGVLGASRARPILEVVAKHASAIHLTEPQQPRACSFAELRALLPRNRAIPVGETTLVQAFPQPGACTLGGPEDTVVATGSIYLIGEIYARVMPPAAAPCPTDLQDRI